MKIPDQPLHFLSRAEWRAWLQANHAAQPEAWLVLKRKSAPGPGLLYEEAVEEALCFGWIDGTGKKATGDTFYLRFSPRKPRSVWSISNQKRVERLAAQGLMAEAGLAAVRQAHENGEWEAAIRREDITNLPDDLSQALENSPAAQAGFAKLPASQKKQLLYWIASARTDATRCRRIQETVDMAASGRRWGES